VGNAECQPADAQPHNPQGDSTLAEAAEIPLPFYCLGFLAGDLRQEATPPSAAAVRDRAANSGGPGGSRGPLGLAVR
jgi:hypothetical protein